MRKFFARLIIFILMGINSIFFTNCSGGFNTLADAQQANLASSVPEPEDLPEPIPNDGKVDVFMINGHMGRTAFSCDDGKTWIKDMSDDNNARCWVTGDPNYVECDHSASAGHGLAYNDGFFFANYGWGYNGSVRRSEDGFNWVTVKTGGWGGEAGGVAYVKNRLFVLWSPTYNKWSYSENLGSSWQDIPNLPNGSKVESKFSYPTVKTVGNDLYLTSRIDGLGISHDQGLTWTHVPSFPVGGTSGGIVSRKGVVITIGNKTVTLSSGQEGTQAYLNRSTDGGLTWTTQVIYERVGNDQLGGLMYNAATSEYMAWSRGNVWRSPDAVTWMKTPITVTGTVAANNIQGLISYNPHTGTFVRFYNVWGNYYDKQRAYRSTNGIHWEMLDTAHFTGGHPLKNITIGRMNPAACL